jgi:hypothetical protein
MRIFKNFLAAWLTFAMKIIMILMLLISAQRLNAQNALLINSTDTVGRPLPLHINDNISGLTYGTNTFGRLIRLSRQDLHYYNLGLDNNNEFYISKKNSTDQAFKINAAGNVGIGLSNPTHLLEIASPLGSTVFDAANIGFTRNSYNYITASDSLGSLVFRTGGSGNARMIISPTGNIGIGTLITTNYKLTVEGAIAARKIRVTQSSGWADFVFEPGYKLVSLEETACFIKANKHLPDVPTASEVAKGGQDLGDMNRILLQKVEELTLHLIEINEKSKQQQEMINQLMEMVKQLQTASKSK